MDEPMMLDALDVGAGEAKLVQPEYAELLPQPPTFRSVDLKREVQKVRDARKRIRLDPGILVSSEGSGGVATRSAAALPSICAYTFHDASDG